jgi:repressor LexA
MKDRRTLGDEQAWWEHEDRRSKAMIFIREFTATNGYPPTRREIGAHLGMKSPSTAQALIDDMIREGLIQVTPRVPRSVVISGTVMKQGEVTM